MFNQHLPRQRAIKLNFAIVISLVSSSFQNLGCFSLVFFKVLKTSYQACSRSSRVLNHVKSMTLFNWFIRLLFMTVSSSEQTYAKVFNRFPVVAVPKSFKVFALTMFF